VPARVVTSGFLQQPVMQFIWVHQVILLAVCQYASGRACLIQHKGVAGE
jgi:hypothetical protein